MAEITSEPNKRYKVGKVISKYDREKFHGELANRWLGDERDPQSLRELADDLNVAVLREAMEAAALEPLDGEVENAYRLLTEDEVSSGMQTAKRNELERDGVDVDSVENDFVMH